jgi:hypothetical protein
MFTGKKLRGLTTEGDEISVRAIKEDPTAIAVHGNREGETTLNITAVDGSSENVKIVVQKAPPKK